MSQLLESPSQNIEAENIRYTQLLQSGVERAAELGFDVTDALAANYGDAYQGYRPSTEEVLCVAAELAAEAELDAEFFERPARTILLLGAADSWISTEQRAHTATNYDPTIAAERHALADLILIAAGGQSGVARSMRQIDQIAADQYILANRTPNPIVLERAEYLTSLENPDLAQRVQALFDDHEEDSLLATTRELLGYPAVPEQPVRVRVLMLAPSYQDLVGCGFVEPIDQITSPESPRALAIRAEQEAKAAPLLEAYATYHERFGAQLGRLAPGWTTGLADGSAVITLTAPYAYGLLRTTSDGTIPRKFAVMARHELFHTRGGMFTGAHDQLGLALEERRAVSGSGGVLEYVDVRLALEEIDRITDANHVDYLAQASRTEDPFSTFLSIAAGQIGLRTTMLLAAAVPATYADSPIRAAHYVNLRFLSRAGDGSTFDSIIRETLERRGSEHLKANARAWFAELAGDRYGRYTAQVEVSSLKGTGLNCTQQIYVDVLNDMFGPPDPNLSGFIIH